MKGLIEQQVSEMGSAKVMMTILIKWIKKKKKGKKETSKQLVAPPKRKGKRHPVKYVKIISTYSRHKYFQKGDGKKADL